MTLVSVDLIPAQFQAALGAFYFGYDLAVISAT